jgi:DNA-binding protein HU-beta
MGERKAMGGYAGCSTVDNMTTKDARRLSGAAAERWTGRAPGNRTHVPPLGVLLMNNADLAETLVTGHGMTKADARKAVDSLFAAIADAAAGGDEISLNGFGKFKVKQSAAREGRNPSTGATIQIAASKKLGFTPAKALKEKLNG